MPHPNWIAIAVATITPLAVTLFFTIWMLDQRAVQHRMGMTGIRARLR